MKAQVKPRINLEGRTPLETVIPLSTPFIVFVDPASACNFKCTFCPDRASRHDRRNRPVPGRDEARRVPEGRRRSRRVRQADQGAAHVQGRRAVPEQAAGRHGGLREAREAHRIHRHDHKRHVPVARPHRPGDRGRHRQDQHFGRRHDRGDVPRNSPVSSSISRNSSRTSNGFTPTRATARSSSRFQASSSPKLSARSSSTPSATTATASSWRILRRAGRNSTSRQHTGIKITKGIYQQDIGSTDTCPYIFYGYSVNADGLVSSCFLDWGRKLVIGDVRQQSMKQIWNSDRR